jgi:hypothetical protein
MGGSFWVVRLAYKLLSEGVLTYAPDNVHLRLAESIPPSDRNRVAWLHFGLMEELYPNVLHKAAPFCSGPSSVPLPFTV